MNYKTFLKAALLILSFVSLTMSQDMMPPKPLESAFFDKLIGEWKGENEFNGMKGKQTVNCKWDLNHQYMVVNVTGSFDEMPGQNYNGTGYYTINNEGKVQGYWFDIFGASSLTEAGGNITSENMKLSVKAPGYTATETYEVTPKDELKYVILGSYEANGQKIPVNRSEIYIRK